MGYVMEVKYQLAIRVLRLKTFITWSFGGEKMELFFACLFGGMSVFCLVLAIGWKEKDDKR